MGRRPVESFLLFLCNHFHRCMSPSWPSVLARGQARLGRGDLHDLPAAFLSHLAKHQRVARRDHSSLGELIIIIIIIMILKAGTEKPPLVPSGVLSARATYPSYPRRETLKNKFDHPSRCCLPFSLCLSLSSLSAPRNGIPEEPCAK